MKTNYVKFQRKYISNGLRTLYDEFQGEKNEISSFEQPRTSGSLLIDDSRRIHTCAQGNLDSSSHLCEHNAQNLLTKNI